MKNNTIIEFADNGIIVRYENDGIAEVWEEEMHSGVETIKRAYGNLVRNTIESFRDEEKEAALGYKVLLEIVPIMDEGGLKFKKKEMGHDEL